MKHEDLKILIDMTEEIVDDSNVTQVALLVRAQKWLDAFKVLQNLEYKTEKIEQSIIKEIIGCCETISDIHLRV